MIMHFFLINGIKRIFNLFLYNRMYVKITEYLLTFFLFIFSGFLIIGCMLKSLNIYEQLASMHNGYFLEILVLQYLPKFFGTAARTYLVDGVHGAGLVHSQKRALANQRCVHLLLRVCSSRWLCA